VDRELPESLDCPDRSFFSPFVTFVTFVVKAVFPGDGPGHRKGHPLRHQSSYKLWRGPGAGRRGAMACLCVALAAAAVSCSKSAASGERPKGADARPVPVTVAVVAGRSVPQELSAIGTVMASAMVSIRAEVSGTLTQVHFCQGQDANKGDVLFTIDPRPFEAALKQAQAALARDRFQAENAKVELEREAELLEKGTSSKTDYDKRKADAEALSAAVQSDEAAVDNAKLQVEHCTIESPLSGRTGDLLVDQGNLVRASDQVLVTIAQVRPIRVSFAIPQGTLGAVKKAMAQGKLDVRATLPREESNPETGALTFVDNSVDKTTGMIQLQATFPNAQERLWPGLFVNVSLVLSTDQGAIVVPAKAIQTGQKGKYVYVVKADNTVELRPVVVRQSTTDVAVMEKGLAKGETVVTDGHLRLANGSKVEIKADLKPAPSSQSAPDAAPGAEGSPGAATAPAASSARGGQS
jgi:membrane fusion protein, multidrug efflux system